MASISKINGQYRIRYYLYTPDEQKLERNRRAPKKGIANELKALADILESRTKRQDYSADDVKLWLREEIISKKDAQALNRRTNATKTLQQAADEWRSTWGNISTQERKTRNARIDRILQILGAETEIGQITYLDAERLKSTLSQLQVHTHLSKGTKPLKARTINRQLAGIVNLCSVSKTDALRACEFDSRLRHHKKDKGFRVFDGIPFCFCGCWVFCCVLLLWVFCGFFALKLGKFLVNGFSSI